MQDIVISIVVPCYNQAQYLPETLQSVLDQEFQKWECLIIDDASPDNTEEVAKRWCAKDERFKYHKKKNGGVGDARNFGIQRASGEYILPLDSDDMIGAHYTKLALDVFNRQPDTKLVYCNRILFGARNEKFVTPPYSFEDLLTENRIQPSGIYRKSDYLKTPGYNPHMVTQGLEDWDFWLSLLNPEDKVVKLEEYEFYYRVKSVSMLTQISQEQNEKLLVEVFAAHADKYLKYFSPIRDHIDADLYKRELLSYQRCYEYRLGKILLYPFRLAQKVCKKLFS